MTKRFNVSMTDEMYRKMHELADQRGQSTAYFVREAVAAYLERSQVRVKDIHPGWGGKRNS